MQCSACGSDNAAENSFCGRCGRELRSTAALSDEIRSILRSELKDKTLVEVQIAQDIAERLMNWAKVFGAVLALPTALLLATLAFWGWHNLSDVDATIKSSTQGAISSIDQDLKTAAQNADSMKAKSEELRLTFDKLSADAARYASLTKDVDTLKTSVARIEAARFESAVSIDPRQEEKLNAVLARYQAYLASEGYRTRQGTITVHIAPDDSDPTLYAFYDTDKNQIWLQLAATKDVRNMLRAYTNSVLYSSHALDKDLAYGGAVWAIESGLADYLPASLLNDASPSRFVAVPLTQPQRWDAQPGNVLEARFVRGWALAAMLWKVRAVTGAPALDRAVLSTWFEVVGQYSDATFEKTFAKALISHLGGDGAKVKSILEEGGIL